MSPHNEGRASRAPTDVRPASFTLTLDDAGRQPFRMPAPKQALESHR